MTTEPETWPDLRFTVHPLPWTWRMSFWRDEDVTSSFHFHLGPFSVEWYANRPMFRNPR